MLRIGIAVSLVANVLLILAGMWVFGELHDGWRLSPVAQVKSCLTWGPRGPLPSYCKTWVNAGLIRCDRATPGPSDHRCVETVEGRKAELVDDAWGISRRNEWRTGNENCFRGGVEVPCPTPR